MNWKLPHKPADMSLEIWMALLSRSGSECEVRCASKCDSELEVDHIHSRGLGGETSLANTRLVCKRYNRERGMTHDPKWEEKGYFDGNYDLTRLRGQQHEAGPGTIKVYGDLFVGGLRLKLLESVSLFALTCGAGKTLLMVASLFTICHEVRNRLKNAPRPKRVLWFVHERDLCRQLLHELKTEITKFKLREIEPEVQICDETGDLERGPGYHDVTISCPQALWGKKNARRTDEQVLKILEPFDTIIWDECDFAVDATERLVRLAPHALKFGLTAANLDAKGDFLRKFFALASVASHASVYAKDHCLRPLLSWQDAKIRHFIQPITHDGYTRWERAVEVRGEGQHGEKHSLIGAMAAIRAAVKDASELEQRMKLAWPDHWYSPHIAVYCSTREEAVDLCELTNIELAREGYSAEDGWSATYGISDATEMAKKRGRKIPREETRLFHKSSDFVNPFMLAKRPGLLGRCTSDCKRIIFLVDIGVRGMNNWPLTFVVDLKRSNSVKEQVQTLGRLARLPLHLVPMHKRDEFDEFCHPRWYFPNEIIDMVGAIQKAWDFVAHMDQKIEAAKLYHWIDILEGRSRTEEKPPQDPTSPFTMMDQLQIDSELGKICAQGRQPTEEEIGAIIRDVGGINAQSEDWIESAKTHSKSVLTDEKYRREMISLDVPLEHIIRPVCQEEPKKADAYSIEELASFIINSDDIDNAWASEIRTDEKLRQMVAITKRREDVRLFRQVSKIRRLQEEGGQPGILTDLRTEMYNELRERGLLDYTQISKLSAAVYKATAIVAGMVIKDPSGKWISIVGPEPCRNDGPMDRPGYHYQLIAPQTRLRIKRLAKNLMIWMGGIGSTSAIYDNEINESDVGVA
jgi:hypothetical protein